MVILLLGDLHLDLVMTDHDHWPLLIILDVDLVVTLSASRNHVKHEGKCELTLCIDLRIQLSRSP